MTDVSESYLRFAKAADELIASGKPATLRAVMLAAGGGSMRDITVAMKTWREQHAKPVAEVVAPTPESLRVAFEAMWASALDEATQYVAAERQALATARASAQEPMEEMTALAAHFEFERDACKAQLDAVTAERDAFATQSVALKAQLEAHRELLDKRFDAVLHKAGKGKGTGAGTRTRKS